MREKIIGRTVEQKILSKLYLSDKSEFVAVYGRRRVGKTFMIKEFFENELLFSVSGLANEKTAKQLENFYLTLLHYDESLTNEPKDWLQAFDLLMRLVEKSNAKRKIILLDELPWMDTPKSGFISALEHFWNDFASSRHDILLVVCGSATSWMMNKLINNHGGLHNRLTSHIRLKPFTLRETEEMLESRGFNLSRYEIAICYMILGGIPFYLDMLDSEYSLTQNIDRLLFTDDGRLSNEMDNLYASLFKNSTDYIKVVKVLSERKSGLNRTEIQKGTGMSTGGSFSTILENLCSCGFVKKHDAYNDGKKEQLYQLVDFYTLFYFYFADTIKAHKKNFWEKFQTKSAFYRWAGLTFGMLAFEHVELIKKTLGISGILSTEYPCRIVGTDSKNTQIDMVIDREDRTVNICEMKFSESEYAIDSDEEITLRNRLAAYRKTMKRKRLSLQLTYVTTFGVSKNKHSGIVNNQVKLDDLFG